MKKHTFKERLVAGMKALGYVQVEGRSHYATFMSKKVAGEYWFVGDGGALRHGRNASNSRSVGCPQDNPPTASYAAVLKAGDEALAKAEAGPLGEYW